MVTLNGTQNVQPRWKPQVLNRRIHVPKRLLLASHTHELLILGKSAVDEIYDRLKDALIDIVLSSVRRRELALRHL